MPVIELKTIIKAPRCLFRSSLDIDLQIQSMEQTNEKAIGGTTSGQIKLGWTVTWKARHFALNFLLTSKMTELIRPRYFIDEMIRGPFKYLRHHHFFLKTPDGTLMTDLFDFQSPLGILGTLADKLILESYLSRLLTKRNELIKTTAERNIINGL